MAYIQRPGVNLKCRRQRPNDLLAWGTLRPVLQLGYVRGAELGRDCQLALGHELKFPQGDQSEPIEDHATEL